MATSVYLTVSWMIVATLVAQTSFAQDLQAAPTGESSLTEINGLVVDETISKVGRDFYEVFYSKWEAPRSQVSYTIFIKELPQIGQGSLVSVYMDDTELFSQPVQPRYDVVEAVAEYAVALVSNYVTNYEQMSQQLGNEDQQGSGIF
ncbi:MAG: CsgE family curli-type amyloid fiber assembly protein [Tunicatimonas sp.]